MELLQVIILARAYSRLRNSIRLLCCARRSVSHAPGLAVGDLPNEERTNVSYFAFNEAGTMGARPAARLAASRATSGSESRAIAGTRRSARAAGKRPFHTSAETSWAKLSRS